MLLSRRRGTEADPEGRVHVSVALLGRGITGGQGHCVEDARRRPDEAVPGLNVFCFVLFLNFGVGCEA